MATGPQGRIISVDSRKVRDLGGAFGFSVDKKALEELGVVQDDELAGDFSGRQIVRDDGTVEFQINVESR